MMIENKLTVMARVLDSWHVKEIKQAGDKLGVEVELVGVENLNNLDEVISDMGKVVLYRSSGLDIGVERTTFLQLVDKKREVINRAIYKTPLVANKFYQQKMVERVPAVRGIKSYRFDSIAGWEKGINKGWLRFPFIMKANLGAEGDKVFRIEKKKQVEEMKKRWGDYVFQNYITNSGNYRVFILGGKVVGVMKRVAAEGEFRNNVSQGGEVFEVGDRKVWREVAEMGVKASSLFGLQMCEVDVIYDQDDQVYRFLEVNIAPQWQGLEEVLEVKVGEEIVNYAKSLMEREDKPVKELVEEYWEDNYQFLRPKQFHYASRRYLWQKKRKDKERVEELKKWYLEAEKEGREGRLRQLWEDTGMTSSSLLAKKVRKPYLEKYPRIRAINRLLFRGLFAEIVYGEDLREEIFKLVSKEDLLGLREKLSQDGESVKALSTIAVNFLYNSSYLLEEAEDVDVGWLLELAEEIEYQEEDSWLKLEIYLLTHMIIGESKYYSQPVGARKEECTKALEMLEELIGENYFSISLDNKFEFLVCCKLCGYQSSWQRKIMEEAGRSLSDMGNFLIDKLNDRRSRLGDSLHKSEHRNVLFLMVANEPHWVERK